MMRLFFSCCLCALWLSPVWAQSSFAPLAEKVMPSAVDISARLADRQDKPDVLNRLIFMTADGRMALGSGFVVQKDGFIVTNRHVIEYGEEISVTTADDHVYKADLVGSDPQTDLALLKIKPENQLQEVVFGDSDQLRVGDWVLAVGNPFGLGHSVSAGIVSAKSREIGDGPYDDYIQTDAAINQGNSGGPMFNTQGELIGINTAIFSDSGAGEGVGFAVPSNQAQWVIRQLLSKGMVERSRLGIEVKPVNIDNVTGLSVVSIAEDADPKWQVGDVITEVDHKPVSTVKIFSRQIAQLPIGTNVSFKILRDREFVDFSVTTTLATQQSEKQPQSEKKVVEGKFYPQFGLYINDQLKVVSILAGSDAENKGVREGDLIVKVDNRPALNAENLDYYFQEAQSRQSPLRLDLQDVNGDAYFVELTAGGE